MKKLFLSLIAVAVGTLSSFAQDDLVATLSHGSTLTTFTGADAFSDAYTAAAEGDVVTLSPGVFNGVDIEKAITIRGAGMMPMESNGYVATQITENIIINVPSNASSTLTIEGVQVLGTVNMWGDNLAPVVINKSRFESSVIGWGINMSAFSCVFCYGLTAQREGYLDGHNVHKNTTINCQNSIIVEALSQGNYSSMVAKIVATNCVVNNGYNNVPNSSFVNCVVTSCYNTGDFCLPESCIAMNCLGINSYGGTLDLFKNIINNTSNVMIEGTGETAYSNIFKTFKTMQTLPSVSLPITETFELTPTAAATYLGDDGTQVGIYGGTNPFNPTPTNPQVKTFTVSSTTEGEQLRVTINVE